VNLSLYSATRFSRVVASGADSLGGTVSFQFVGGYMPTGGTVFDFFQASGRSGTFATSLIPSVPGHSLSWCMGRGGGVGGGVRTGSSMGT
jgi:hypothetical protein